MAKTLHITVVDKVATYCQRDGDIVCGNNDYQISFAFDSEWNAYDTKTARFIWGGQFCDVDFTGDTCDVPIIYKTDHVRVGVYAGDLRTTTEARIGCLPSILCDDVTPNTGNDHRYANEAKAAADRAEAAAERAEGVDKRNITLGLHTDGLIYIFIDGVPTGNGIALPSGGVSGDVVGNVDSENNIVLLGNLADGTYTVKYEMEDGSTVDIGELVLADKPSYTNQIPISTDADGNLFVGTNGEAGYKTEYRLSLSSGNETTGSGYECTGFIPATIGDSLSVKDIDLTSENATNMILYDSNKQPIKGTASVYGLTLYTLFVENGTEENGVYTVILTHTLHNGITSDLAYIRIGSKSITDSSILTVNQKIM